MRSVRMVLRLALLVLVAASSGCGESGGGGPLRVGGRVTGLVGPGLVLRLGATETLAVDADGAFAFRAAVATGDAYAVTILSQPDWRWCEVAHGAGTVGTASVTTVAVTCRAVPGVRYDFEDGSGTTAADGGGGGRDATLVSAGWSDAFEGRHGAALRLELAGAGLTLPAGLLEGLPELTVSAWVRLLARDPGTRLFELGTPGGERLSLTLDDGAGAMRLARESDVGAPSVTTVPAVLPLGVWKHLAVALSPAGATLFVDGHPVALDATFVLDPATLGPAAGGWIGRGAAPGPALSGFVDEVRLDGKALGVGEVRELAWPRTDYSIWHFDEAAGGTAADGSDNHRTATLRNGASRSAGALGRGLRLANPAATAALATAQHAALPGGTLQDCTSGFTVAAWIRPTSGWPGMRVLDVSHPAGGAFFARAWSEASPEWAFGVLAGELPAPRYASIDRGATGWEAGRWHHVAAVLEGQALRVHVDGEAVAGDHNPTSLPAALPPSLLGSGTLDLIGAPGAGSPGPASAFDGDLDELLISCRPYAADEIRLLAMRPP